MTLSFNIQKNFMLQRILSWERKIDWIPKYSHVLAESSPTGILCDNKVLLTTNTNVNLYIVWSRTTSHMDSKQKYSANTYG